MSSRGSKKKANSEINVEEEKKGIKDHGAEVSAQKLKNRNIAIIITVIVAIVGIVVLAITTSGSTPPPSTPSNQADYKLLYFGSDGCPACEQMKPHVLSLKSQHSGKVNVLTYDPNYSTTGARKAREHNINTIPTLVYLNANGNEVYRSQGFKSQTQVEAEFRRLGWIS